MDKEKEIKEKLVLVNYYAKGALRFGDTPAGKDRVDLVLSLCQEVKRLMEPEDENLSKLGTAIKEAFEGVDFFEEDYSQAKEVRNVRLNLESEGIKYNPQEDSYEKGEIKISPKGGPHIKLTNSCWYVIKDRNTINWVIRHHTNLQDVRRILNSMNKDGESIAKECLDKALEEAIVEMYNKVLIN